MSNVITASTFVMACDNYCDTCNRSLPKGTSAILIDGSDEPYCYASCAAKMVPIGTTLLFPDGSTAYCGSLAVVLAPPKQLPPRCSPGCYTEIPHGVGECCPF